MVRAAPVAYLELMEMLPGERGRGVAAALVGELHRVADESGVEVTLLHYEQVNPLSGPFWHQQGYRPLWTSWRPGRPVPSAENRPVPTPEGGEARLAPRPVS